MSRAAAYENPFISGTEKAPYREPTPAIETDARSLGSDEQSEERTDDRSYSTSRSGSKRGDPYGEKYSEKSSDWGRHAAVNSVVTPSRNPFTNYAGSFAPNPSFIRLIRFLLYGLASLSALVTAGVAISVVAWYNSHTPSIKPSWGSLIALIVFGIITPGFYFIPFLFTPRMFRYGSALGIVNQVRVELVTLFSLCVIWVSGALAMANDLRGYENCIWDGYYHYPEPSDFNHVCDLINATVAMGYTTFGLVTLAWFVVSVLAMYILFYLDQEVLSELTNDMGGRAYRARTYARQSMQPPAVMATNHDRLPGPAAPSVPGVHRRSSSSRSGFDEYEREYQPAPFSPTNPSGNAFTDDDMPASRRIPNPDAAVPMSEKQALAERYGRDVERQDSPGPMMQ